MKTATLTIPTVIMKCGGLGIIISELFFVNDTDPVMLALAAFLTAGSQVAEEFITLTKFNEVTVPVIEKKKPKKVVSAATSVEEVYKDHKIHRGRLRTDWVQFEKDIARAVYAEEEDKLHLPPPPEAKPVLGSVPAERRVDTNKPIVFLQPGEKVIRRRRPTTPLQALLHGMQQGVISANEMRRLTGVEEDKQCSTCHHPTMADVCLGERNIAYCPSCRREIKRSEIVL